MVNLRFVFDKTVLAMLAPGASPQISTSGRYVDNSSTEYNKRIVRLTDIPLDTETIPADQLNIESKTRSNLFQWNGQFSPQLVHTLLKTFGRVGDFVADPFAGSGTVLVEAGRCCSRVVGTEINPAAFLMSQTYQLMNMPLRERTEILQHMDGVLRPFEESNTLFANHLLMQDFNVKQLLLQILRAENRIPFQRLLQTLIILSDYYEDVSATKVLSAWRHLRAVVQSLPFTDQSIELLLCDARKTPISPGSVDLVITSPPYINVFNYHQQYRASAEALGWNLLNVAHSEIGSNRKHRSNRLLTVIQYCLDIAQVMNELKRITKDDGRIIFVVGRESTVRKTRFFNGDIVGQLGSMVAGFQLERRQERVFKNRFGQMIYEDIIHFRPTLKEGCLLMNPCAVAEGVLANAMKEAPFESRADFADALANLYKVQPSPLFDQGRAIHEAANSAL